MVAWYANQKPFNRLSDVVESKSMNDSTAIYVFLCDSFYVIFRCMKSIGKKVKGNVYTACAARKNTTEQIDVRHILNMMYDMYV